MGCSLRMKEFGEALHALLYFKREVWAVLPDPGTYTWTAGGCWILAQALHQWLGEKSSLQALKNRGDDEVEHVVVKVGSCYLDGDGAWDKLGLLTFYKEEGIKHPYLGEFRQEEASRIDCSYQAVEALMAHLEEEFGPGPSMIEWTSATSKGK